MRHEVTERSNSNSQLADSPRAMPLNAPMALTSEMSAVGESDLVKTSDLSNNEVDSVINSLPDMNEIESFDSHSHSCVSGKEQFQDNNNNRGPN